MKSGILAMSAFAVATTGIVGLNLDLSDQNSTEPATGLQVDLAPSAGKDQPETVQTVAIADVEFETEAVPASDVQIVAALADTPIVTVNAPPAPSTPETEVEKQAVLCGLWYLQRFAERAGIIDDDTQSIAEYAYPVPAPVWLMDNLFSSINS